MINLFCSKLLIKLISISIQIYSKFKYKLGNLVREIACYYLRSMMRETRDIYVLPLMSINDITYIHKLYGIYVS